MRLFLSLLLIGLGVGCTTTTTCTTCFVGDSDACQRWSGGEEISREITARKLCEGKVPAKHAKACTEVMDALAGSRVVGGGLQTPLVLPAGHLDATCTSTTKFAPFSGCGGFR